MRPGDFLPHASRDDALFEDAFVHAGLLAGRGVDVPLARAFASAAAEFHRSSPWTLLGREDWIRIESSVPRPELTWVEVLGASQPYEGVAFRATVDPSPLACPSAEHVEGGEEWLILFGGLNDLWPADTRLWEKHGLEVAGPGAYPSLDHIFPDSRCEAADAPTLRFLTGLLSALARSHEVEIDSGRWTKQVEMDAGAMSYVLSLTDLLHPIEPGAAAASGHPSHSPRFRERLGVHLARQLRDHPFKSLEDIQSQVREQLAGPRLPYVAARTPFETAQDLVYEAYESRGHRRRIQIARRALELSPGFADACVLLAEESFHPQEALSFYREAVARTRADVDALLEQLPQAHVWLVFELRPLLRGLAGQGEVLRDMDNHVEAVACFEEYLRLDAEDHLEVRVGLACSRYLLGRPAEALAAIEPLGKTSFSTYLGALATFQREGDSPEARRLLKAAVRSNEDVPRILTGGRSGGGALGARGREDEHDALHCAIDLRPLFEATPGALDWMKAHGRRGPARTPPARRGAPPRRHNKRR